MASRLTLRIQERRGRLTASELKIADVLQREQGFIERHTATELAASAGVSKATTARFFRRLGYADFEEVRLQARDERNRLEPYRAAAPVAGSSGLGRTIGEHLQLEIANLTRTFEALRPDLLSEIAEQIATAPTVWLLGFGAEDAIARLGGALLGRYRHGVRRIDGGDQDWAGTLAAMAPRDLLIVFWGDDRPGLLRSVIGHARTSRARVLTLTDPARTDLAQRFSDAVLPCHVSTFSDVATHASAVSMLRLLTIATIARDPDGARQRAETLETIRDELGLD